MQKSAPPTSVEYDEASRLTQNSIEGGVMLTGVTAVADMACLLPSPSIIEIITTDFANPRRARRRDSLIAGEGTPAVTGDIGAISVVMY